MRDPVADKSTVDEIRERFDSDVERFSDLDLAQAAVIDAPLMMELITEAAVASTPDISVILDIGCGAGNNSIKLLRKNGSGFDCDLCDLSLPMLERALERVSAETPGKVELFHGDFRTMAFQEGRYDVILAAAVFHHLRDDADWESCFTKVYRLLRPGGSFWVTDLVTHELSPIDRLMWNRYKGYLTEKGGASYAEGVFGYIEKEDTPRPLTYQLDLMRRVGFKGIDVLHKNSCFAAFGGVKGYSDTV